MYWSRSRIAFVPGHLVHSTLPELWARTMTHDRWRVPAELQLLLGNTKLFPVLECGLRKSNLLPNKPPSTTSSNVYYWLTKRVRSRKYFRLRCNVHSTFIVKLRGAAPTLITPHHLRDYPVRGLNRYPKYIRVIVKVTCSRHTAVIELHGCVRIRSARSRGAHVAYQRNETL